MRRFGLVLCLGSLTAVVPAIPGASAQPAPAAASARLDARAVVAEARRIIAENYVIPERRAPLDAALAKGLAEGRYDVSDPRLLAQRMTEDMAAVAHDKHLVVEHDPGRLAQLTSGRQRDDGPTTAEQQRIMARRNHGVFELKLLPGNIRYMDYRAFAWAGPKSAEVLDHAARFLQGGDAVIIDLRRNGGGSPDAVQYLISHFLEPNRPIVTFHMGREGVDRLSSLPSLPAGRMVGKPLYVLTSGSTASAAESSPAMSPASGSARSSARRPPAPASATNISLFATGW